MKQNAKHTMKNDQKVTIYASSEFMGNVIKYEGKLIKHGTQKYAQYDNAPFVQFVRTGKRKPVQILKTFQPFILVLEGIGHPEPSELFTKVVDSNSGVVVKESTYSSFDDRWETDFDNMIDGYISQNGIEVIADYRHTKGFNSSDRFDREVQLSV